MSIEFLKPERPCWIEIDRRALHNNVQQIQARIGDDCEFCAVVKANAYGHGAVLVARELVEIGVGRFAVATLGEALELRDAGIAKPILVLGYTPVRHAEIAVACDITVTVYDLHGAVAFSQAAVALGKNVDVHVKVNTGMNRLGVRPEEVVSFIRELHTLPSLQVEGVFTHFATSDTDLAFANVQFDRFAALLKALDNENLRPPVCHAANSAAMLRMPETHLDMVRCGIALYGLAPDEDETPIPPEFHPVLSWQAEIAQVKQIQPGEGVSYGLEFVAERPTVVAVIPVGYADGFPRRPKTWGTVLVHGHEAPIVGRVCMDQTVLDVTGIVAAGNEVSQGDEAVLIGRQGDAAISAEEAARRIETINYDVVSRILSRVPRELVGAA